MLLYNFFSYTFFFLFIDFLSKKNMRFLKLKTNFLRKCFTRLRVNFSAVRNKEISVRLSKTTDFSSIEKNGRDVKKFRYKTDMSVRRGIFVKSFFSPPLQFHREGKIEWHLCRDVDAR